MDPSALFKIGYGLYVLTSDANGKDNGCIVNAAMQVTSAPNRIAVTVNKLNYTRDLIMAADQFNLSVLDTSVPFEVFKHFGFQSGRDTDKFADYSAVSRSENGLLYLTEHSNAMISGKVICKVDLDTHTMFIADVTDAMVLSDQPTVTYDYYQANIKPKPEAPKKSGWRCKICGYVYEGDVLPDDFTCPWCKHGPDDFERIEL